MAVVSAAYPSGVLVKTVLIRQKAMQVMKKFHLVVAITALAVGALYAPAAQAHPYMVGDSWANLEVLAAQA